MLKHLSRLLATSVALTALVTYAQAEGERMGYTTLDLTNPYFVAVSNGMKDRAAELGIELTVHDAKSDAASQVSAIENFIVQDLDAIIVSPIDAVAVEPLVQQARDAGIAFINPNQKIEGADAFIAVDEFSYGREIGTVAGQYIAGFMNGEAEVGVLIYPELAAVIARGEGIKEGILAAAPNAKIVAEQSAATPENGARAAETILQSHPNVRVIVGINDAGVLGAYEAIAGMGVPTEEFALFGLDATEEALAKIKEGGMYKATVDIDPYGTGKLVIDTALQVIKDGPIQEMINIPMIPVTAETVR